MGFSGTMFQRTEPWANHHFLLIDGVPCVYHGDGESLTVELPGSICRRISELKAAGKHITMPKIFRHESPGVIKNNPETRAAHRSRTNIKLPIPKL